MNRIGSASGSRSTSTVSSSPDRGARSPGGRPGRHLHQGRGHHPGAAAQGLALDSPFAGSDRDRARGTASDEAHVGAVRTELRVAAQRGRDLRQVALRRGPPPGAPGGARRPRAASRSSDGLPSPARGSGRRQLGWQLERHHRAVDRGRERDPVGVEDQARRQPEQLDRGPRRTAGAVGAEPRARAVGVAVAAAGARSGAIASTASTPSAPMPRRRSHSRTASAGCSASRTAQLPTPSRKSLPAASTLSRRSVTERGLAARCSAPARIGCRLRQPPAPRR